MASLGYAAVNGSPGPVKEDMEGRLELLEEFWFYDNLLDRKPKTMARSFSDPSCTAWNHSQEAIPVPGKLYEEAYESIKKLPGRLSNLIRAPSIPLENVREVGRRKWSRSEAWLNSLSRAPSLPSTLRTEEYLQDDEVEFSMGKLIRQASLSNSATNIAPRNQAAEVLGVTSSRISTRSQLRLGTGGRPVKSAPQRRLNPPRSLSNNLESLEFQHSNDFKEKDLKSISDIVISSVPAGLMQEKRRIENMKIEIKFWARAVASSVRLGC